MAREMSSRDRFAIAAYEEHCKTHGLPITEDGRNEWVREWRSLDEEQRQDGVDAERDANPSSEIDPVFDFPEVGRHTQTGDGEKLWILARGSIGRSEQGFHSRIEILHEYEPFNIAGFWDNPRAEAATMDGIPQGWSGPFTTYEEASRDVKRSLVEFDRHTAQSLQRGASAGTGSYAHVNRLLAQSVQSYWPQAREPEAQPEPREPNMDLDR